MSRDWRRSPSGFRFNYSRPLRGIAIVLLAGSMGLLIAPAQDRAAQDSAAAQDQAAPKKAPAEDSPASPASATEPPPVYRFDVPLPLTGLVDQQVEDQVERVLRTLPTTGARPTFIFEFRPKIGTAGEGSNFGRALSLARLISDERLGQVRTVAWLPRSVTGHAVLPVLACEQIVMQKDAELGAAGHDETSIDATLRRGYTEIAESRRTVPPAIALGLLDKDLEVYKVTTPGGVRYELADELARLLEKGEVTEQATIFQPGDPHALSGKEMRFTYGFASHLADDKRGLAAALELPAGRVGSATDSGRRLAADPHRRERPGAPPGNQFHHPHATGP